MITPIPPEDQNMLLIAAGLVALVSMGLIECKYVNDKRQESRDKKQSEEFIKKLDSTYTHVEPKTNEHKIFLTLSGLCIVHFNEKEFIHIRDEDWKTLTNHYNTNILSTNVTINFYD